LGGSDFFKYYIIYFAWVEIALGRILLWVLKSAKDAPAPLWNKRSLIAA
jgi:hypothetical protein